MMKIKDSKLETFSSAIIITKKQALSITGGELGLDTPQEEHEPRVTERVEPQ